MANLWPTYVFKINLPTLQRYAWSHPNRTTLAGNETVTEEDNLKDTRSTWLPSMFPGVENLAHKHGDTFTVSGLKAVYLKNTYVKGLADDMLFLISS
jgi:hypothetical protein